MVFFIKIFFQSIPSLQGVTTVAGCACLSKQGFVPDVLPGILSQGFVSTLFNW